MPTTGQYDAITPYTAGRDGVSIPVWDNGGSAIHLEAAGLVADGSTSNTDAFAALSSGHYLSGGTGSYLVNSTMAHSTDATIPSGVVLEMKRGQTIDVASGFTLIIAGEILAGSYQIFTGDVRFTGISRVVDAAWWGGVPGASSLTAKLQKALGSTASASGANVIQLGAGNYVVDTLEIQSGTRLLGQGQALTTLTLVASNGTLPLLTSFDESAALDTVEIAHLTINGNRGGVSNPPDTGINAMGIRMCGWTNAHIHDVTIKDCYVDGIYLGKSGQYGADNADVHVDNVTIANCRRNNISVTNCLGGSVRASTLTAATGVDPKAGIDIEPAGDYETVQDFEVEGCHITGNAGNGVQVYQAAHGTLRRITLRGNFITGNTLSGVLVTVAGGESLDGGITIDANTVVSNSLHGIEILATSAVDTDRNLIANNRVESNTGDGIHVEHSAFNLVEGNQVRLNGASGIFVTSDTSKYNRVVGNLVEANVTQGIYLFGCSYNAVSDNTVVRSGAHGIALSTGASHNQVTNNFCTENSQTTTNTSDNILIHSNCDYNNVQGNTCRIGALTNQPRYGLRNNSTDCDGNLVTNNDLYSSGATGGLSNAGTGTVTAAGNR